MRSPFEQSAPLWQRGLRSSSIAVSIGAHIALGIWVFKERVLDEHAPVWVEMTVVKPKPPPPPPPEPEKEPEPPKPKPTEAVKFEDTVEKAPEAPPERKPVRRLNQGLNSESFAPGSGTGVNARAGNTTSVKAGPETMGLDEAAGDFTSLAYAAVTTKPSRRTVPPVEVPQAAIDAHIEGTWTVYVDLDATGRVTGARMAKAAGYGIDEACVAAWTQSRWKPGMQGKDPVPVTGIPVECQIKETPY